MDTLEYNGVIFTKATVLAKRLGYTTDYIGQLCRAGKVEARLVGRAWFVREDALLNHKADRYKSVRPAEILLKHNADSYSDNVQVSEKVQVYPRISKHLHRNVAFTTSTVDTKAIDASPANVSVIKSRYDSDSHMLHPEFHYLREVPVPKVVEEQPVDVPVVTQKIMVRNETARPKKLYFEPLTQVSLSGDLKIQNLDAEGSYVESAPVALEDISEPVLKRISPRIPESLVTVKNETVSLSRPIVAHVSTPLSFTPQVALLTPVDRGIPFFIPVVSALAVVVTIVMLTLTGFVESDGSSLNQSLRFNLTQVSQVFTAVR